MSNKAETSTNAFINFIVDSWNEFLSLFVFIWVLFLIILVLISLGTLTYSNSYDQLIVNSIDVGKKLFLYDRKIEKQEENK